MPVPSSPSYRGRFAPSPTGPLHAGSMLAALGSWLCARQAGGQWLVRIEDIDPPREVTGAAQGQLQALAAFGLHHDGEIVHQRQRAERYRAALDGLLARGAAFECHCSRADLIATGGIHRRCATTVRRQDPAIRLRVADGAELAFEDLVRGRIRQRVDLAAGDFVLRRADGLWAYQLAVVVDDAAQQISHVVRGADLIDSTPRQVLLQQALGLPTPRYTHLPLLLAEDGKKLSKSDAALPVDVENPLPTLQALWRCLGQQALPPEDHKSAEAFLAAAACAFRPNRIPAHAQRATAALHNGRAARDD